MPMPVCPRLTIAMKGLVTGCENVTVLSVTPLPEIATKSTVEGTLLTEPLV